MAHEPIHPSFDFSDKGRGYADLATSLHSLLEGERNLIANLANTAALIYHALPDLNWAGFYLIGPNAQSAATRETQLVPDVHTFPGHIACDSASNSEIVIPMIFSNGPRRGELLGVLDLDSPLLGRFDEQDQRGLEKIVAILMAASE
jgi:GAF domain-containing protein